MGFKGNVPDVCCYVGNIPDFRTVRCFDIDRDYAGLVISAAAGDAQEEKNQVKWFHGCANSGFRNLN